MSEPLPDADAIDRLEALSRDLAALEPALQRWLAATADRVADPLERERARRAALQLRLQVSRIAAALASPAPESAPAPWHGQERRSPQRATNVARLPERHTGGRGDTTHATDPKDWEPF
ncbi:MAG: hypothetical protein AB7U92_11485 [Piscinibacter sp.]|uniref:hypothetical protein n=1 Tax=Piscinibacter sp. TaxID=1903157 RepID=UPI003D13E2F8